jgi:hypothetical protein
MEEQDEWVNIDEGASAPEIVQENLPPEAPTPPPSPAPLRTRHVPKDPIEEIECIPDIPDPLNDILDTYEPLILETKESMIWEMNPWLMVFCSFIMFIFCLDLFALSFAFMAMYTVGVGLYFPYNDQITKNEKIIVTKLWWAIFVYGTLIALLFSTSASVPKSSVEISSQEQWITTLKPRYIDVTLNQVYWISEESMTWPVASTLYKSKLVTFPDLKNFALFYTLKDQFQGFFLEPIWTGYGNAQYCVELSPDFVLSHQNCQEKRQGLFVTSLNQDKPERSLNVTLSLKRFVYTSAAIFGTLFTIALCV